MDSDLTKSSLVIENIDRKKCVFHNTSRFVTTSSDVYSDPEVIIIKTEAGRVLFNRMIRLFDYKEKGVKPIARNVVYPHYVFTCDCITMGCRFGIWEFHVDIESLANDVNIDNWQDDFSAFQNQLLEMLA